ncbi:hypothetical protein BdWA1_002086 [Babesia duncani]|uniref:Uncharacterized protein n=1 Tax=Babesia duncani TaxID=323732 RepID=A0AAD9PL35_9APIC|nr:hypothetical protein BdWA1_002086 [Babesia duncani]
MVEVEQEDVSLDGVHEPVLDDIVSYDDEAGVVVNEDDVEHLYCFVYDDITIEENAILKQLTLSSDSSVGQILEGDTDKHNKEIKSKVEDIHPDGEKTVSKTTEVPLNNVKNNISENVNTEMKQELKGHYEESNNDNTSNVPNIQMFPRVFKNEIEPFHTSIKTDNLARNNILTSSQESFLMDVIFESMARSMSDEGDNNYDDSIFKVESLGISDIVTDINEQCDSKLQDVGKNAVMNPPVKVHVKGMTPLPLEDSSTLTKAAENQAFVMLNQPLLAIESKCDTSGYKNVKLPVNSTLAIVENMIPNTGNTSPPSGAISLLTNSKPKIINPSEEVRMNPLQILNTKQVWEQIEESHKRISTPRVVKKVIDERLETIDSLDPSAPSITGIDDQILYEASTSFKATEIMFKTSLLSNSSISIVSHSSNAESKVTSTSMWSAESNTPSQDIHRQSTSSFGKVTDEYEKSDSIVLHDDADNENDQDTFSSVCESVPEREFTLYYKESSSNDSTRVNNKSTVISKEIIFENNLGANFVQDYGRPVQQGDFPNPGRTLFYGYYKPFRGQTEYTPPNYERYKMTRDCQVPSRELGFDSVEAFNRSLNAPSEVIIKTPCSLGGYVAFKENLAKSLLNQKQWIANTVFQINWNKHQKRLKRSWAPCCSL